MQRVRIGLTGLACVFLLVLLAAAFFGLTNDERSNGALTVPAKSGPETVGAQSTATPREPLAELGVTPGFGGDGGAGNSVAPEDPPPADPGAAGGLEGSPSPAPPQPR